MMYDNMKNEVNNLPKVFFVLKPMLNCAQRLYHYTILLHVNHIKDMLSCKTMVKQRYVFLMKLLEKGYVFINKIAPQMLPDLNVITTILV